MIKRWLQRWLRISDVAMRISGVDARLDKLEARLDEMQNTKVVKLSQNDLIAMVQMGLDPAVTHDREEFQKLRLETLDAELQFLEIQRRVDDEMRDQLGR